MADKAQFFGVHVEKGHPLLFTVFPFPAEPRSSSERTWWGLRRFRFSNNQWVAEATRRQTGLSYETDETPSELVCAYWGALWPFDICTPNTPIRAD